MRHPPPQEEGNYRAAHAKLLRAALQLRELGGRPPRELLSALLLLHSYVLVRSLVALEEHLGAARMLARVTRSISRWGSAAAGAVPRSAAGSDAPLHAAPKLLRARAAARTWVSAAAKPQPSQPT